MDVSTMLDQLSDFQAQADYLELKRQELINEVKIPAEVLAAQDEANKARQKADSDFFRIQSAFNNEREAELSSVEEPSLPPEYLAAVEATNAQKNAIRAKYAAEVERQRQKVEENKSKIDADLQAKVADVYRQVETRKSEINTEFSEKSSGVKKNITDLTEQIKASVEKVGESVKGQFLHAVYSKGRTTWSTDALDYIYFSLHSLLATMKGWGLPQTIDGSHEVERIIDEMTKARKVGKASVAIKAMK